MQGLWLQACRGAYSNVSNPIVAFLEAGGDVHRRLTSAEVSVVLHELDVFGRFC